MKNEQRAAAARMLKRAQALGLQTKSGTDVVVDLMEELLAAAAGYRNAHAWRAAAGKAQVVSAELPALELVNPQESGSDYRLVNGRGCWVEAEGCVAHVYLRPDGSGMTVDLHTKDDTFDPVDSASMDTQSADAAATLPNLYTEAFSKQDIERRLEALEEIGIEVCEASALADHWVWHAPTSDSDDCYPTRTGAILDAWYQTARAVCAQQSLTDEQWDGLDLAEQCRLVRELMDD